MTDYDLDQLDALLEDANKSGAEDAWELWWDAISEEYPALSAEIRRLKAVEAERAENDAIESNCAERRVVDIGKKYHCYGALITALRDAWVKDLMNNYGFSEEHARKLVL